MVVRHDTLIFFFTLCKRTLTFVFNLWQNICVQTVQSKSAPISKIQHVLHYKMPCVLLDSDSKYHSQNRIFFYAKVFWRASSADHGVIPSMLMKRGWKCPLKSVEGGEQFPLKEWKLGAPWKAKIRYPAHQENLTLLQVFDLAEELDGFHAQETRVVSPFQVLAHLLYG